MRYMLRGVLALGLTLLCEQAWAQSTFLRDDGTFAQVAGSDISGAGACTLLPALTGDITSTAGTCATSLASAITFTGKTLTGGNVNALTTLSLRDTGAAFNLSFISTINSLSANRSITWNTQNGSRVITMGGDLTLGGTLTTSGASALTLTTAGVTNSTLPAGSHTLAGLDVIQTWSANQTFNSGNFLLAGSSSGSLTIKPAAAAGSNTLTLPAGTTDFSATGGTSQVVKQTTSGGAFTVARLACADLSDAGTGCAGSSAIVVGTTVVSSGTSTRILYDNAGVVGEYTLTGSGTVVAMQTAPTFVTSATVPLVIGGSGTTGTQLAFQTTTGNGTTDALAFKGGNNGGTTFGTWATAGLQITSAGSAAFAVGRQGGSTGPAFSVDASTGTQTAGFKVTGAALNGTVALVVTDTSGNTNLTINALGSGTIGIGSVSTGAVTITPATTLSAALTYGGVTLSNSVTGTGSMVLSTSPTIATPTITTSAVIPLIGPAANSTTAVKITKADLSTAVMTFDTSNARVGINRTPGAFDLDVNNKINVANANGYYINGSQVLFTSGAYSQINSPDATGASITFGTSADSSMYITANLNVHFRDASVVDYFTISPTIATIKGATTFSSTTASSSTSTGGGIFSGGIGVAKAIYAGNEILSVGPTNGIGYATGAGGAQTQLTSRTTAVTLNTVTGAITLFSAAGSATATTFTLTNSAIAATDVVHVTQKSGTDKYEIFVTATAAGSCQITFFTTGGTTTEQPVFNFVVLKGVTS